MKDRFKEEIKKMKLFPDIENTELNKLELGDVLSDVNIDRILFLRIDNYSLEVVDNEAELPGNPNIELSKEQCDECGKYSIVIVTQQDMLNAGFKKVIDTQNN